jgi:hypothetical protein
MREENGAARRSSKKGSQERERERVVVEKSVWGARRREREIERSGEGRPEPRSVVRCIVSGLRVYFWTETVLRFVVVVEAGKQAGCTQRIETLVSHTLTHTQFVCVLGY